MKSFDFYDTLFTRLVAKPTGIFFLMEEILGYPGFAARRIQAELDARHVANGEEVNLEEIYQQLKLSHQSISEAVDLELRLERELVVPIVRNMEQVCDSDLIVSDMYLPSSLLQSIIEDHRVANTHPKVIVSNELRLRKLGGALWRHLRKQYPDLCWHLGDNRKGDVLHPRKMGMEVEYFREAELNRYEKSFVVQDSLDGLLIAGLSRATRLSSPPVDDNELIFRSIDDLFSSVIAPLLIAFVEHVIEDSERQGIDQLYFLARDGQLLHRIAEALISARNLPLQAHYIYGSRHALHLPGLTSLDLAESWLIEDTPHLSLAEIASRGELPPELVAEVGNRFGFHSFKDSIIKDRRPKLKELLRVPEIEAQLRANSTSKWRVALDYYRQVGLNPDSRVTLVDVGWTGRLQASLRALLDKAEDVPVSMRGYYLCLSSKLKVSDYDTLEGFLYDPDVSAGFCSFDPYRCVVESCLMADHGTTLGFRRLGGVVKPVLGRPVTEEGKRGIARQQSTVLRFVEYMLKVEQVRGKRITWPRDILAKNLIRMLQDPGRKDASAFAGRAFFEGQADNLERQIVRRVAPGFDWLHRQSLGLWPEGSLTLSGGRLLLTLVRAARWFKLHVSNAL